jgi:Secretion system C-terminal sorting domain
MKKIYLVFCVLMAAITTGNAQSENLQVINSTGSSSEGGGYSLQWSIGELALVNQMNAEDGSYILTNGFVQPMQASYNNLGIYVGSNNVRIYPNPTSDILEIDFLQNISGNITIQLSNNAGQIMYTNEIAVYGFGFIEKINMKKFTKGNYTLYIRRITPGSGLYESQPAVYKIIKL